MEIKGIKSEVLHIRTSPRYKRYVEILAKTKGIGVTEYFNDVIRKEAKQHFRMIAEVEAIERMSEERGIPDHIVYMLLSTQSSDYLDHLKDITLEQFRARFQDLYVKAWYSIKKEFGLLDDVLEVTSPTWLRDEETV
jgi:hypothetical protein